MACKYLSVYFRFKRMCKMFKKASRIKPVL